MLNASAAKIYLCLDPTDMRKSFDTLAALVREHLQGDPQSGTWFVFRGKQGNRLKILYWDCLLYTSPSPRDGLLSRMPSSA